MEDPVEDENGWTDYGHRGGVNYILHDLVWEKSALHMKQYIHKTYLGGSRYQFSVCKSCVNHMQNRGEHIVTPGPSYMIHLCCSLCTTRIHESAINSQHKYLIAILGT